MITASIVILSYAAGVLTPFVYFAFDWHWGKRRRFFGEGT